MGTEGVFHNLYLFLIAVTTSDHKLSGCRSKVQKSQIFVRRRQKVTVSGRRRDHRSRGHKDTL